MSRPRTAGTPRIKVQKLESVIDRLDTLRGRLAARAHELFRERGGEVGRALDDWLTAERELVWTPAVELSEKDNVYCLELASAGIDAKDLDIQMTPDHVVVSAPAHHQHAPVKGLVHLCEFARGGLFRTIRFPRRVDPDGARAEYRNGLLRLTVPVAAAEIRHVDVAPQGATGPHEPVDTEC